jgi:hypothetical protein
MTPLIKRCALLSNVTPSGKYLKDDGTVDTPGTGPGSGGDVVGPSSSLDNQVPRFDQTTGKVIQASLMTVDDNGSPNIPTGQTFNVNGAPHTHPGGSGTGNNYFPGGW